MSEVNKTEWTMVQCDIVPLSFQNLMKCCCSPEHLWKQEIATFALLNPSNSMYVRLQHIFSAQYIMLAKILIDI